MFLRYNKALLLDKWSNLNLPGTYFLDGCVYIYKITFNHFLKLVREPRSLLEPVKFTARKKAK
jgi:hypothetical protein